MNTNMRAQINEFTDLEETITNRPIDLITRFGVVFLAVANATGTAITIAIIVPSVAMLIVSQMGFHSLSI